MLRLSIAPFSTQNAFFIITATTIIPSIASAAIPTVPAQYSPINGSTNIPPENATFSWSSSGVGVSYRIVVSSNQSFTGFNNTTGTCDNTCGTTITTSTKHTRTLSIYGKKYFWKIKAYTSSGSSPWSPVYSFTSKESRLAPPFSNDQTWYICQGYNGAISHQITSSNKYSLDLSYSPQSVATTGCAPSTSSSSTGQTVVSPDNGKIAWIGQSNSDITCIDLDSGGSIKMGHFYTTVKVGTRITRNQPIGKLTPPGTGTNGGYAHIHMKLYSKPGCPDSATKSPIDYGVDFGTAFGAPNLYYDNKKINQWSGTALYK